MLSISLRHFHPTVIIFVCCVNPSLLMFIYRHSAILACESRCPAIGTGSPAAFVGCSTVHFMGGGWTIQLREDQLVHMSSKCWILKLTRSMKITSSQNKFAWSSVILKEVYDSSSDSVPMYTLNRAGLGGEPRGTPRSTQAVSRVSSPSVVTVSGCRKGCIIAWMISGSTAVSRLDRLHRGTEENAFFKVEYRQRAVVVTGGGL